MCSRRYEIYLASAFDMEEHEVWMTFFVLTILTLHLEQDTETAKDHIKLFFAVNVFWL